MKQCNARDSDISEVVRAAEAIVRHPDPIPDRKIAAATLLVMLDIRSFLDRSETALINIESESERMVAELRAQR